MLEACDGPVLGHNSLKDYYYVLPRLLKDSHCFSHSCKSLQFYFNPDQPQSSSSMYREVRTSERQQTVSKYRWTKIENVTSSHRLDAVFNSCLLGLHPSKRDILRLRACIPQLQSIDKQATSSSRAGNLLQKLETGRVASQMHL